MLPGVYFFMMASGLSQIAAGAPPTVALLGATAADGITAFIIILAMGVGLSICSPAWITASSGKPTNELLRELGQWDPEFPPV